MIYVHYVVNVLTASAVRTHGTTIAVTTVAYYHCLFQILILSQYKPEMMRYGVAYYFRLSTLGIKLCHHLSSLKLLKRI